MVVAKKATIAALKGSTCKGCIYLEIDPGEEQDFENPDYYCTITGEQIDLKWCIHWESDVKNAT